MSSSNNTAEKENIHRCMWTSKELKAMKPTDRDFKNKVFNYIEKCEKELKKLKDYVKEEYGEEKEEK